MPFSAYLEGKRKDCRELVAELSKKFSYVSVLGSEVHTTVFRVDRRSSSVSDGAGECGFVVKMHDGKSFFEYSLDDISGSKEELAEKIISAVEVSPELHASMISGVEVKDEPMKEDFVRESDFHTYSDEYLLSFCGELRDKLLAADPKVVNAVISLMPYTTDKIFVTKNKELTQHYGWCNASMMALYSDGKMARARSGENSHLISEIIEKLPNDIDSLVDKARHLAKAKPIEPGVYDVITDSSISGLIAHEAFGHGVEMDQFVKDRAMAKHFVGDYVASPITNMRDGASATLSAASYFFDDDGVPAHNTQIIKDGILVAGLSDLTSASELGTEPTGNGRRDNYRRKAYARMTNTFFDAGTDKLEDMIASVKHGYMLFETSNGMEDPKNWQIQCTAQYGIEIVDGKLTENYVSPVVMSGSVPDLLKSITMVSDEVKVIGAGSCGKGYKEWVKVSDGGPALKVRVKLG